MKNMLSINSGPAYRLLLLLAWLFTGYGLSAQQDTGTAATPDSLPAATETPAAEESSLISPTLTFTCVQAGDKGVYLKAAMRTKIKGTSYKLYRQKIVFKQVTDSGEIDLGAVVTDGIGEARFTCAPDKLIVDKNGQLHFKAVYAGNKGMEAAEEEVLTKPAVIELTPLKEDSTQSVQLKLTEPGKNTPIAGATVSVYVKRLFKPLKIGEGTTDENGEATVEIPSGLPGDAKGQLTLYARVEENETYGNVEAATVQKWGKPVSDKIEDQPRALWSVHPPLWMLITFIILMVTVWGHYVVIVFELFRLRKERTGNGSPA